VTRAPDLDGFPMPTRVGQNRNGSKPHETKVFVADRVWKEGRSRPAKTY
jgi:hypothetical protein